MIELIKKDVIIFLRKILFYRGNSTKKEDQITCL